MTKINEKLLKEAEDNKAKEPFLLVIYDVPSENREGITDNDKIELRSKRMAVTNELFLKGAMLQKSAYIVRTEKVREVIDYIDGQYNGSKWEKEVNVRIAGTVFKDTVLDVLKESVTKNLNDLWEKLDLIQAKANDFKLACEKDKVADYEKQDKFKQTLKQQLYQQNRTINSVKERIEDLKSLGYQKTEEMTEKLESFTTKRRNILYHFGYNVGNW
jgi:hypothetical protein